jgi:hypothetical protein
MGRHAVVLKLKPIPELSLKVIELWNAGNSSGLIADELDMTRSQVSGIIHRLKGRVAIVRGHNPLQSKHTDKKSPGAPKPEALKKPPPPPPLPPPVEGLGIHELKKTSCRWPVAGCKDSMRYCGATTYEPPYCEHHSLIAYATPVMRQRK